MKLLKVATYYYSHEKFFSKKKGTKSRNEEINDQLCFWCLFVAKLGFADPDRDDHRHVLLVTPVLVAVCVDQISLFKLNCDEDVCSRGDGKVEMRDRHRWRRPEGEQPAEIEWMTNV